MKLVVISDADLRLDKYLSIYTDNSRELISKKIDDGFVLVNGGVKKNSYKVKLNDEIEIKDGFSCKTTVAPKEMDIDIVYEDDDLMVINKPSGLVVHPGSGNYDNTLVNGLMYYTENLSNLNGSERVGIVHRLDKDTSGLMLVAKTNKAHEILSEGFKNHDIKRTYVALLNGVVPYENATIDAPIKRDEANFNKMGVFENGKDAITHMKVVKRFLKHTLVKLNLETGRTHQIRVHMAYIGFPVHNDPVYGTEKATDFGQFLHSKSIDFVHPISGKELHFEVDEPKEFQDYLDTLE